LLGHQFLLSPYDQGHIISFGIKPDILAKIPQFKQNNLQLVVIRNLFQLCLNGAKALLHYFGIKTLPIEPWRPHLVQVLH
jgi:hypothetical protein